MKKDLIERLRRFLIAHDTIGTPVSMTKEEAKKKILDSALKSALVIIFVLISIMPTNLYKSYMQSKLQLDLVIPVLEYLNLEIILKFCSSLFLFKSVI